MKKISFGILILAGLFLLSAEVFAQKSSEENRALEAVKTFYQFHLSHAEDFDEKQIALRSGFFTPKLKRLFDAELRRQRNYAKKYPDDKPYFEGLPFQPIEFCPKDYRVGTAKVKRLTAIVRVNFIYGKSSCTAKDGDAIFYQILLTKIHGRWLVDNVIYDDSRELTKDFETAAKIR